MTIGSYTSTVLNAKNGKIAKTFPPLENAYANAYWFYAVGPSCIGPPGQKFQQNGHPGGEPLVDDMCLRGTGWAGPYFPGVFGGGRHKLDRQGMPKV